MVHDDVRWHTYFRDEDASSIGDGLLDLTMFADLLVDHALVGRAVAEKTNPYLSRSEHVDPRPATKVSVLDDVSTVRLVDDGARCSPTSGC